MSTSTATIPSSAQPRFGGPFWDRLWRLSGFNFVVLFAIAAAVYGAQPQVGATPEALTAFYAGERTRILIASAIWGVNILNLMWFAAALRTVLAEAGRDGWGAAVTTSSAIFGTLSFLLLTVVASLAYSIAGAGDAALVSGLNDLAWGITVLISFPRAMLVMAGAFGLWRAGLISNGFFAVGVAAVVLNVLSGTTWLPAGIWSPGGAYSNVIAPVVSLVWLLLVTRVVLMRPMSAPSKW